jgi:hypothetical protein
MSFVTPPGWSGSPSGRDDDVIKNSCATGDVPRLRAAASRLVREAAPWLVRIVQEGRVLARHFGRGGVEELAARVDPVDAAGLKVLVEGPL